MRQASGLARVAALSATLATAAPGRTARAEVVDAAAGGFTVRSSVTVFASPQKAYAAAVEVGRWWDPAHTYSGDSGNLTLDARPGGCWCERLPDGGGVQHMTVVYADPGKALRCSGGLGPLQELGVAGGLTWRFEAAEKATRVELTYSAGGYRPGGMKELAPGVDAVIHGQLERYKRYVDTGKP